MEKRNHLFEEDDSQEYMNSRWFYYFFCNFCPSELCKIMNEQHAMESECCGGPKYYWFIQNEIYILEEDVISALI